MYLVGFETFPYNERNLESFKDFFAVERYDKKKCEMFLQEFLV